MITKTDLTDVTFLIPLRIDSIDRLENLLEVISFIDKHFDTNIHLLESSEFNNHILPRLLPANVVQPFVWTMTRF